MLGAGAAGYAISKILLEFGIGDVVLYNSKGPLYRGRTAETKPYKRKLAEITNKNNEKAVCRKVLSAKTFLSVSQGLTWSAKR